MPMPDIETPPQEEPSPQEPSLQGWDPAGDGPVDVPRVVELAFGYRGNVTIYKHDGTAVVGYLCNRDAREPEPRIEYMDEAGDGPFSIPYADIANIRFTGTDPAKGNSYAAYQQRKTQDRLAAPDPGPTSPSS